jgi:hypothetical protein
MEAGAQNSSALVDRLYHQIPRETQTFPGDFSIKDLNDFYLLTGRPIKVCRGQLAGWLGKENKTKGSETNELGKSSSRKR